MTNATNLTRYDLLEKQFNAFDVKYPEVYKLFKQFTEDRIHLGYKHYSSDAVLHRVRWETSAGNPDIPDDFKINNNFSAFYARKFMNEFPQHAEFFRTRTQISKYRMA